MFKDLGRNQAVIIRAAKLNCFVLALCIVGCEPTAPGFDALHPRSTADCTQHIDGSAYPSNGRRLGENDVSAGIQQQGNTPPFIDLMYSVSNRDTLRLDSREFTAVGHSGETIAKASAALWLNPLVHGSAPELGDLPVELRGDGSVRGRDRYPEEKKTFYRVVLTFDQALPEQFDLHAPDI